MDRCNADRHAAKHHGLKDGKKNKPQLELYLVDH